VKYGRFEEVPVWKAGIDLTVKVFGLTENAVFRFKGDIANQIQRAALSVPNNIAEGFERGTTPELITFLYYARGSAGEVRSILWTMEQIPAFGDLRSKISDLKLLAESISRQLRAWADSLQNTDIKGQRHLTEGSRRQYENKARAERFMKKLKEMDAAREKDLKSEVPDKNNE